MLSRWRPHPQHPPDRRRPLFPHRFRRPARRAPAPAAAAPGFSPDAPPTQDFIYPSISNNCGTDGGTVMAPVLSVAGPAKIPTPGPNAGQTAYVFTAVGTPGPADVQKLPLNVTWVNLTTGKSGSATLKPQPDINPQGPTTLTATVDTGSGSIMSTIFGQVTPRTSSASSCPPSARRWCPDQARRSSRGEGYVFTAVGTPGPADVQKLPLNVTWVNLTTGKSGSATLKPQPDINPQGPTTLTATVDTGSGSIMSTIFGQVTTKDKQCQFMPTIGSTVVP